MTKTIKSPVFEDNKVVGTEDVTTVNYMMLIPVLTKAIQEQQDQIDKLEELVTRLSNKLDASDNRSSIDRSISGLSISQNTPNPFSSATTITYNIPPNIDNAILAVFDLTGKMLLQYDNLKGRSQVLINSSRLPAGTYVYSLLLNGKEAISKRMILTK